MSYWKTSDAMPWDDRTLLKYIHKATVANSIIVLELSVTEEAPQQLHVLELEVARDNLRTAAPIGLITPEGRRVSEDGMLYDRFKGTTAELLQVSPGGIILQGHSEGTHINAAHTIFCGLANEYETFVPDCVEVSGGCSKQPELLCKWRRHRETEIISYTDLLPQQPVVALVCESVSLARTAWVSSTNLLCALSSNNISIGIVGYVQEEDALAISRQLGLALARGESLAQITLQMNRSIATEEGAAVIIAPRQRYVARGTREIMTLFARTQERSGSMCSAELTATPSLVPTNLASLLVSCNLKAGQWQRFL